MQFFTANMVILDYWTFLHRVKLLFSHLFLHSVQLLESLLFVGVLYELVFVLEQVNVDGDEDELFKSWIPINTKWKWKSELELKIFYRT